MVRAIGRERERGGGKESEKERGKGNDDRIDDKRKIIQESKKEFEIEREKERMNFSTC